MLAPPPAPEGQRPLLQGILDPPLLKPIQNTATAIITQVNKLIKHFLCVGWVVREYAEGKYKL